MFQDLMTNGALASVGTDEFLRLVFIGGEETYHLEKDLHAALDMARENVFFDANRLLSAIAVDVFTEHFRDRDAEVSSKEYKSV